MFEWVYQICSEAQPIRARTTLHFNLRRFFWASFEAIIDALELPHAEPPLLSMMIYLIRTAREFTCGGQVAPNLGHACPSALIHSL
jgi:hypothetical protein